MCGMQWPLRAQARRLALAGWLLAGAAAAEPQAPAPEGGAVDTQEEEAARRVVERLRSDEALRLSLARRILASSVAGAVAGSRDPSAALGETADWISGHPGDAAHLALGFAKDDEDGLGSFERSLRGRVARWFALNPKRHQGILGTLQAAGSESRLILKKENIPEEEQRDLVKRLFDGQGGEQAKILTVPGEGGATAARHGTYDRISSLNPTGYSPQVLSYQSALNAQRVPGAPRIVETGKLDYATLSHPAHAVRHDLKRLDAALRAGRAAAAARLLGRERKFPAGRLADPAVQSELEAALGARALPERFDRRRAALQRGGKELERFLAAVEVAKDPRRITRNLLRELGATHREAARWIRAAAVEAELQGVEGWEGLWSPDLDAAVRAASVSETSKRRYLARVESLKARARQTRELLQRALSILNGPDFAARANEVERGLSQAQRSKRGLPQDLALTAQVAWRLGTARPPVRRWGCSWGRRRAREERELAALTEAFERVASGDFAGAQKSCQGALTGSAQ